MTTGPRQEIRYEVVIWDYDAAPDAADYFSQNYTEEEEAASILPYYCAKRFTTTDLRAAKSAAWEAVHGDRSYYTGAAVFLDGQLVKGYGFTFPYQKRYL